MCRPVGSVTRSRVESTCALDTAIGIISMIAQMVKNVKCFITFSNMIMVNSKMLIYKMRENGLKKTQKEGGAGGVTPCRSIDVG